MARRHNSEDLLAWLFSFACLIYILRSIKQVLLPAGGFWRSPFVIFLAGAFCAIVWVVIAVICTVLFLTERARPREGAEEGAAAAQRGAYGARRPFLLRRRPAARGAPPLPQLVTAHPGAVREGSFTGPVWLVPATLWTRSQMATQWPPPTDGPAAIALKFHATLISSDPASSLGPALLLVPERTAAGLTMAGAGKAGRQGAKSHDSYTLMSLEGVSVDLLRDVLGNRSPWTRRAPMQLSHPARPLLLGETTIYMFAESGSAKEQWYAALQTAVAPQSLLAATQELYADYCRYMASLQLVQPPPMPPPQPPPGLLQPQRQDTSKASTGPPKKQSSSQGKQPSAEKGKEAAQAPVKKPPPAPARPRQQPQATKGTADPSAPPRPRGGRNPFGFILSRFGRGPPRGNAAPTSGPASREPSAVPSVTGASTPGGTPRQASLADLGQLAQGAEGGAPADLESESQTQGAKAAQDGALSELDQAAEQSEPHGVVGTAGDAAPAPGALPTAGPSTRPTLAPLEQLRVDSSGGLDIFAASKPFSPVTQPAQDIHKIKREAATLAVATAAAAAVAPAGSPIVGGPGGAKEGTGPSNAAGLADLILVDDPRGDGGGGGARDEVREGSSQSCSVAAPPCNSTAAREGGTDSDGLHSLAAGASGQDRGEGLAGAGGEGKAVDSRPNGGGDEAGDASVTSTAAPGLGPAGSQAATARGDGVTDGGPAAAVPAAATTTATAVAVSLTVSASAHDTVHAQNGSSLSDRGPPSLEGATPPSFVDWTGPPGVNAHPGKRAPTTAIGLAAQAAAAAASRAAAQAMSRDGSAGSGAGGGSAVAVVDTAATVVAPGPAADDGADTSPPEASISAAACDDGPLLPLAPTLQSGVAPFASPVAAAVVTSNSITPSGRESQAASDVPTCSFSLRAMRTGDQQSGGEGAVTSGGEAAVVPTTAPAELRPSLPPGADPTASSADKAFPPEPEVPTAEPAGVASPSPPLALLAQQSRHGSSMPNLFEAARRMELEAEEQKLRSRIGAAAPAAGSRSASGGGGAPAVAPASPGRGTAAVGYGAAISRGGAPGVARRSLDQHLAATQRQLDTWQAPSGPGLPPSEVLPQLPRSSPGQALRGDDEGQQGPRPQATEPHVVQRGAPTVSGMAPVEASGWPGRTGATGGAAVAAGVPLPPTPRGSGGGAAGAVSGTAASEGGMPRNLSKQDLKRLQREEQERLKQEQQRARAAAKAAEEARKAEEKAARERAKAEAQQRRQEEEARAREAKERARSQKQLASSKSQQNLSAAAGAGASTPPPASRAASRDGPGGACSISASPKVDMPPGPPSAAPDEAAAKEPAATQEAQQSGGEASSDGQPAGSVPSSSVPLPAPSAPPLGALVEGLYGLNMVLVRIGFELLRRRGFQGWLHRLIQNRLDRARRPGFLERLTLQRFDLGYTAPQLRDIRAVAGPNNFGPTGTTWPQLVLQVVWVGNATATIATKIDFDQASSDPSAAGIAAAAAAEMAAGSAPAAGAAGAQAPPTQAAGAAATDTAAVTPNKGATQGAATVAPTPPGALNSAGTTRGTAQDAAPTPARSVAPAAAATAADAMPAAHAAASADGPAMGQRPACPDPTDRAHLTQGQSPEAPSGVSAAAGQSATSSTPFIAVPGLSAWAPVDGTPGDGRTLGTDTQPPGAAAHADNTDGQGNMSTNAQAASGKSEGPAAAASTASQDNVQGGTTAGRQGQADGGGSAAPGPERARAEGGGGKFWWNLVPFFSLIRSAAQSLASNLAGSLTGTPVEVRLQATRFEGTLLLWLAPPPSDRLWLSFAEPPKMDFTVTPVLGNRKLSGGLVVGRLSAWVRGKVTAGLTRAMVYPSCVDVGMGRLLLSIDSPGDSVRPFMPPTPPPAPAPPSPPRQQAAGGSGPFQANPPVTSTQMGAPGVDTPFDHRPSDPNLSSGGAGFAPGSRTAGRPPRGPPSVTTTPVPTPRQSARGGGSRASLATPGPGPGQQQQPSGFGLGFGASGSSPMPFTASVLAAATSGLTAGGSASSSLLESALQHVIRRTSSILGSSPGTLSPLDGMSDAGDGGAGEGEEWGDHDGLEEDDGWVSGELGERGPAGGEYRQSSADGEYWHEYGSQGGRGRGANVGAGDVGGGLPSYWSSGGDAVESGGGPPWPYGSGSVGPGFAGEPGADGGAWQATNPRDARHPRSSLASLASTSSLQNPQWQPAQGQMQEQQQQQQQQRRGGGGPLHWARGAASLVARGVGGVGGAGVRGLGAVGSALGQAVLGPVVNAGERALAQQQFGQPSRKDGK